jgi:hypothetical protein
MRLRSEESSAQEFSGETAFHFDDDADDDASVGTGANANADGLFRETTIQLMDHGGKDYDGWKPHYSIPVEAIEVRQHHKKTTHLVVTMNRNKQERDCIFDTLEDSKKFVQEIEHQKRLESERQEGRLKAALGDIVLPKQEEGTWLIEIVSGFDLPIGDFKTSDPYVICMLGQQEVHRTKHISGT